MICGACWEVVGVIMVCLADRGHPGLHQCYYEDQLYECDDLDTN